MKPKYQIKSRFWIDTEAGTLLGEGKVKLLQSIVETGSISAAARELNISYRKAWKMIDVMNSLASEPVVERQIGGKSGGGTIVTPHGKKIMELFLELKKKCTDFTNSEFQKFQF